METDSTGTPKTTFTETLFVIFLRTVAVSCFWFGIQYWAMLTGYSADGAGRFDMLVPAWRAAGIFLAVVFPVAALGLWLGVSWGPVIWICGALVQVLMHTLWSDIFGASLLVPLMYVVTIGAYGLFRAALILERREKVSRVSSGLP